MSIDKYLKAREEFSAQAEQLKGAREVIRKVSQSLDQDPFSFSFTRKGNLLSEHPVRELHYGFQDADSWPSADELMEAANRLHELTQKMREAYDALPDEMRSVVQAPNDLIKDLRNGGRY